MNKVLLTPSRPAEGASAQDHKPTLPIYNSHLKIAFTEVDEHELKRARATFEHLRTTGALNNISYSRVMIVDEIMQCSASMRQMLTALTLPSELPPNWRPKLLSHPQCAAQELATSVPREILAKSSALLARVPGIIQCASDLLHHAREAGPQSCSCRVFCCA